MRLLGIETELGIIGDARRVVDAIKGIEHENVDSTNQSILKGATDYGHYGGDYAMSHLEEYVKVMDEQPVLVVSPDQILKNGARWYVDMGHPEICTPECSTPLELVMYDRACEQIASACADIAQATLSKNNTDGKGHSFGCHENYLINGISPAEFSNELTPVLTPFFVTRQIIVGAGKLGIEKSIRERKKWWYPGRTFIAYFARKFGFESMQDAVTYQLSQRADFIESVSGLQTTYNRPLINLRDEPHLDREKYMRLHVINGDANRAELSTYLKTGLTSLVLDLFEDGFRIPFEIENPVEAMKEISRDQTYAWLVSTNKGSIPAVDIQRVYLEAAQRYRGRDTITEDVLDRWESILDRLEQDPMQLDRELDWVIKKKLLDDYCARNMIPRYAPEVQDLNLIYHYLVDGNIFHMLESKGMIERLTTEEQVAYAMSHPPETTRAWLKSALAEKFNPDREDWSSMRFTVGTSEIHVRFMEPFTGARKNAEHLLTDNLESTLVNLRNQPGINITITGGKE